MLPDAQTASAVDAAEAEVERLCSRITTSKSRNRSVLLLERKKKKLLYVLRDTVFDAFSAI